MEIEDKKLVGVLVEIIIILSAVLTWLYTSTPQAGKAGDRPQMPQGVMQDAANQSANPQKRGGAGSTMDTAGGGAATTDTGAEE